MINKQSIKKARKIDKELIKLNRKEIEKQKERSFAIQYRICPKCASNLNLKEKRKEFLDYIFPFYNPIIILKCEKCGFKLEYQQPLY